MATHRSAMAAVVSLVLIGAALSTIRSRRYCDDRQPRAFDTIGVVVGYWLRPDA